MKYVILIYHNPKARELWESFSPEERAAGLQMYQAINDDLAASGELIATEALTDPTYAQRITVRDGQTTATDGPFAETKEHLCGFIQIEARDLNEAIRLASGIPMAKLGSIEVRPVLYLEPK